MWDWSSRTFIQAIDLGKGSTPLEIRFLHDPAAAEGFVGCALSGAVHRFYKTEVSRGATADAEAQPSSQKPADTEGIVALNSSLILAKL